MRMAELISPVAIGVISDPPTIVLCYDCMLKDGERRKRRKRKMPLRDFTDKSNVKRYAFNLRQRHNKYLADVIDVTLEKMLRMIQEIQRGNSVETAKKIVNKEYSIDENEDLNKLSPAKLAQRKAVMDEMFHKNLVKPCDPNFVYDREIEFEVKSEKSDGNDWDEESEKYKGKNDRSSSNIDEIHETRNFSLGHKRADCENDTVAASQTFKSRSVVITNEAGNTKLIDNKMENETTSNIDFRDDFAAPGAVNTSNEIQMKTSFPPLDVVLSKCGPATAAMPISDDESSSTNNIEDGLNNIECGLLEEEDEDFWE